MSQPPLQWGFYINMGWRIVEVSNAQTLKLYIDNLLICCENKKYSISLKDIDVLIIDNYQLMLSIQLINKLSENNTIVILCDNRHLPSSQILPFFGNHNTLKIFQSQKDWTPNQKGICWQKIIKLKIKNQIGLLNFLNLDTSKLKCLLNQVQVYDISNREGHAAKIYWHCLFGKKFNRKNESYINVMLNYSYAILMAYISRSIVKKGLDTRISIFHKSFSNYYALASDLMEPFRPIVDFKVYQIINDKPNDFIKLSNAKTQLIDLFNKKINILNKDEYINNAIDNFIDGIVDDLNVIDFEIKYGEL